MSGKDKKGEKERGDREVKERGRSKASALEDRQSSSSISSNSSRQSNLPTYVGPNFFKGVFSATERGFSTILADFLDMEDVQNLTRVSRDNQIIYSQLLYKKLIKKNIGPDPNLLIDPGETALMAYRRHRDIIHSLPSIRTQEGLEERVITYPYYYFHRIKVIIGTDYAKLFSSFANLEAFRRNFPEYAYQFIRDVFANGSLFAYAFSNREYPDNLKEFRTVFPAYIDKFVKRLLTDDELFAWVFRDGGSWQAFREASPVYADTFVKHVFANDALFVQVFEGTWNLARFQKIFPECSDKILEHVLANDMLFIGVFGDLHNLRYIHQDFSSKHVEWIVAKIINNDKIFNHLCSDNDASPSRLSWLIFSLPDKYAILLMKKRNMLKMKAKQQAEKDVGPTLGLSANSTTTSSSSSASYNGSRFTSLRQVADLQQARSSEKDVKMEAKGGRSSSGSISNSLNMNPLDYNLDEEDSENYSQSPKEGGGCSIN